MQRPSQQQIALTADIEGETSRVVFETETLLGLFEDLGVKATLFFVGNVPLAFPELVRRAAAAGHEIAFHGHRHLFLSDLTRGEFRTAFREQIPRLEDLAQQRIAGFRAPFFSLNAATSWVLEELMDMGFSYDASIYPGYNDRYGWPGAPRHPVVVDGTDFVLFPVPLLRRGPAIAFSGGAYLRILPRPVIRWGLQQEKRSSCPHMIYVHPWELFPDGRGPGVGARSELRQMLTSRPFRAGLKRKLEWLISAERERIDTMQNVIANLPELPEWSLCRAENYCSLKA